MEYQYSGPGDAVTSKREDLGEPCRVGTVVASERRKLVVTDDHSCTSATPTTFPSTSLDVPIVPTPLTEEVEDQFPPTETQGEVDVCPVPATPTVAPTAAEASLPAVLTKDLAAPTAATIATPSLLPATPREITAIPFEMPFEMPATPIEMTATPIEIPTTPSEVIATPIEVTATPATNATLLPATTATLLPTESAAMPLVKEILVPLERHQTEPSGAEASSASQENVIAQVKIDGDEEVDQPSDGETLDSDCLENKAEDEDLYEDDDIEHRTESDTTRIGPDTSGDLTPESLTDDCPSDDEDEKFADALSNPIDEMPDESATEQDPQPAPPADGAHGDSPMSNGSTHEIVDTATPQATATPRTPYHLRQREPVDYRKMHMGAVTQTATNLLTK
ncbi:hypothetical protein GE061_019068 [Apolygus lucorum]|uniref:Uncharacterized protein n=1 Tax=Apolygus lucorum TaxID=248454 RepID=A0A8S9X8S5_APOLU|nr:hypothetical protein GE061_019068 [Apolygus lucorum]